MIINYLDKQNTKPICDINIYENIRIVLIKFIKDIKLEKMINVFWFVVFTKSRSIFIGMELWVKYKIHRSNHPALPGL